MVVKMSSKNGQSSHRQGTAGVKPAAGGRAHPIFVNEILHALEKMRRYADPDLVCNLLLFVSLAMRPDEAANCSRLWILEGEPGTGKTETVRCILKAAGITVKELDPCMLERPNAGEPAEYITRSIFQTSQLIAGGTPAALMCEDLDLSLKEGTVEITGTKNTSQALSCLQQYADNPTQIAGQPCNPVPLLGTMNDASCMRESAIRAGRVIRTHFNPKGYTLARMAQSLLADQVSNDQLASVIRHCSNWRIAHYRDLKERLERMRQKQWLANTTLDQLFDSSLPLAASDLRQPPTNDEFTRCVAEVEKSRTRRSYLA